ncbi:MAG: 4-alpha-glucanotransferase [Lautropia sp.]
MNEPEERAGRPGDQAADSTALQAQAERVGVELGYRDAHGNDQTVSPAVVQRLVDALEPDQPANPAAANSCRLPCTVACTVVARVGDLVRIELDTSSSESWTLTTENGVRIRGGLPHGTSCSRRTEQGAHGWRAVIEISDLEAGYHSLELHPDQTKLSVIVGPRTCWLPVADGAPPRHWGISAQLYLLQSENDWGIGDYSTLRALIAASSRNGADLVGLNPLHAMFIDRPTHASPYSPASRLLLNVLNIDVEAIPEATASGELAAWMQTAEFRSARQACHAAPLVDYQAVARLKMTALGMVYRCFMAVASDERRAALATFRRERGVSFERHCVFLALRDHLATRDQALSDWSNWPEAFRSPQSAAVVEFARGSADAVTWQAWLQWVADEQLAAAASAASAGGMAVGLYRDLAVGANPAGAETWSEPAGVVRGARVGAPPDIFNPHGQNWGLLPFNPLQLARSGYRTFVELLRANMRHAGALRIDHVMALQHLYCIPEGNAPDAGAYVTYPFEALLTILALESHRHRCAVIGEDLGTVPDGFRERLQANGVLSYRVLFFERDQDGCLLPADSYPVDALAVAGNHDLPTIRGWLAGRDVELSRGLGLRTPDEAEAAAQRRMREVAELIRCLGLPPADPARETADDAQADRAVDAIHRFLAAAPSRLMVAQFEDLTGETEQVNMPSASDGYPNWQRRYGMSVEAFGTSRRIEARLAALSEQRPG